MAAKYTSKTTGAEVAKDLSAHIRGKTVLITGVSPGSLGAKFAETIVPHGPALLILAGRDLSKTQATLAALEPAASASATPVAFKTLQLDLASLGAVRRAAAEVLSWSDVDHVDVLVNNAGVMAQPFALTADGVESQFAANHLGHFLFTNLLLKDRILASAAPRVVSVSSAGHRYNGVRWGDVNFATPDSYDKWRSYAQSKTANMLFAVGLADKLGEKGLVAASLHPGIRYVETHAGMAMTIERSVGLKFCRPDYPFMSGFRDIEQGIATHVLTAFSPDIKDNNGKYFLDCRPADPYEHEVLPWATGRIEADMLWKLSEELVGEKFEY
ncbi:hypothetical protein SLS62_011112 [Diatrype stigma]|uniref:Uncharacterized protein n=1 Tax=Diatrype stigma TaxID=117547 RepID=A0AAN9U5N2_9PEZI